VDKDAYIINIILGLWGRVLAKTEFTAFSCKIRHLVTTILVTFLRLLV